MVKKGYSIITNKNNLRKQNATIKQVLKKNRYQESIISTIYQRITNNFLASLSQSNKCRLYISKRKRSDGLEFYCLFKVLVKKIRFLPRSGTIRSTFYNKSNLSKLSFKLKEAKEDKKNIVYKIDCGNFKAV